MWSETDVVAIRREEAEKTVRSLRADLRKGEELRQRGDRRGCRRKRERAAGKMAAIFKMLERRIAVRAEKHFGNDNPHLVQEALEEAFELLRQDLEDTGVRKHFYEVTFNRCAKWTVVKAIRIVRKRHGMRVNVKGSSDREKQEDLKRERARIPDSLEDREYRAEEGERVSVPVDSETRAALERFAGPNLLREILARMPDHNHRKVLIFHAGKRLTFAQTAEKVGISEKTARRYYGRAVEIAKRTVREQR